MGEIIAWVQANWLQVAAVYSAIVTVASIIVKLTPTLKDDTVLLSITKFIAKYFALNTSTPTSRPS